MDTATAIDPCKQFSLHLLF